MLFAEGSGGIRMTFQTPVGDHDAFGDGLFGGGQQALVEPDGVGAGDFVQAVADFGGVESAAHAVPIFNVFREDEPRDGLSAEEALRNAPRQANGLFVVTKVVE